MHLIPEAFELWEESRSEAGAGGSGNATGPGGGDDGDGGGDDDGGGYPVPSLLVRAILSALREARGGRQRLHTRVHGVTGWAVCMM